MVIHVKLKYDALGENWKLTAQKYVQTIGVVHKWRHVPRRMGVHDIMTMCDIRGRGWKVVWRHARHICGKTWPVSRGWYC